jgi:hypothetical protein
MTKQKRRPAGNRSGAKNFRYSNIKNLSANGIVVQEIFDGGRVAGRVISGRHGYLIFLRISDSGFRQIGGLHPDADAAFSAYREAKDDFDFQN